MIAMSHSHVMSNGTCPQVVNPLELVVITYGAAHIDTICSQEEGEKEGGGGEKAEQEKQKSRETG